jgi:hypothetical protein
MSDNEGWIPHDGGKMPCDKELWVYVKLGDGREPTYCEKASFWTWGHTDDASSNITFWRPHKNADGQVGQEVAAAPDEALIEEIAYTYARRDIPASVIKAAIREYIRRSAGKENG